MPGPRGLPAEHHPRQVDRVAADVEQRATAVLEDVPDVGGVVVEVREPALDRRHRPDAPARDEVQRRDPGRVVAVHERLHQVDARLVAHASTIRSASAAVTRAASRTGRACRRGGGDRPVAVQVVRQRDVDGVDVRVGEQGLVRAVGASGCRAASATARALLAVARGDRDHLAARAPCASRGSPSGARCSPSTGSPSAACPSSGASSTHPYLTWPRACTSLAHTFEKRGTQTRVASVATSSDTAARPSGAPT